MPISVIIPTYRNPEYLDLCLLSAIEGQVKENQIIVIVDGFPEESEAVLQKHAKHISVLPYSQNMGQTHCHNAGVTLAENEQILIVNDDNVFPKEWDKLLSSEFDSDYIISPNQMEPNPSIFKSFIVSDKGKTPAEFNLEGFQLDAGIFSQNLLGVFTPDGQTWPVFMSKHKYMGLGGIDPSFPSPAVADWDFFMRAEMMGLKTVRYSGCVFYHFAGAATKKDSAGHNDGEMKSHAYFAWKWGQYARLDENNRKVPITGKFRGR
jgi:glycosyltransferase involved in cell wall biosynthesis